MGILEKLFKLDKNEEEMIIAKEMDVEKEINTILLILRNLSTLNTKNIDSLVKKLDKHYDESILYRLRIDIDQDSIEDFKTYFSSMCSVSFVFSCLLRRGHSSDSIHGK